MKASEIYLRAAQMALSTTEPSCICVSKAASGRRYWTYNTEHPDRKEYMRLFTRNGDCAPFAILDHPQEIRCLCLCLMSAIAAYGEKRKP